MVLRFLNLEGQLNCMIVSKVTAILPPFFSKNSKTSNICMWGVYPEAIDWNIVVHTQISFWVSVCEEKALSEPKNLQNGPYSLSAFRIQLQIWSPKMKSECKGQYFSLLPLDKHPTCLCLKFLNLLKKLVVKLL